MGYSRSRARCVPLQYLSSATRGVKQALNHNKQPLNENLTLLPTLFQERENISEKALNLLSKDSAEQVSQSESGMFYELSNKKRMECEKYQDCSWFQQSPIKSSCNSKSSLAETFDSFIDADEFDLPMQYANAQISPWGDEYLEVFTDDILLEKNHKMGEKSKNCLSDESFFSNYRRDENYDFDSSNINFSLKKTDSFDSMKNISSTNPSEVIPISYKERLNNSFYEVTKLREMKSEVKNEVELYSPESSLYLMDSDENDLNIGREEIVEEMNLTEDSQLVIERKNVVLDQIKCEVSEEKILSECAVNDKSSKIKDIKFNESNFKIDSLPIKTENGTNNNNDYSNNNNTNSNSNSDNNTNIPEEKLDLNLDISKLHFEQPLNLNTPDLDFMDLVEFINEEMRQENDNSTAPNSTSNGNFSQTSDTNNDLTLSGKQTNAENEKPNDLMVCHPSISQKNSFPVDNSLATESKNESTVDFNEISSSGISIAERIKTSAKRRTRKSVKEFIETEGEESCESFDDDDDDDDDDDYDYKGDVSKQRCSRTKRRTKSSISDSSLDSKRDKEESSTYRERRDKNNEASRRSRQNRKAREKHMYETLEAEEKRNVKLKAEADILEKQVTSLRQLLLQVVLHKGSAT